MLTLGQISRIRAASGQGISEFEMSLGLRPGWLLGLLRNNESSFGVENELSKKIVGEYPDEAKLFVPSSTVRKLADLYVKKAEKAIAEPKNASRLQAKSADTPAARDINREDLVFAVKKEVFGTLFCRGKISRKLDEETFEQIIESTRRQIEKKSKSAAA